VLQYNHSLKLHRFEQGALDRQTEGSIDTSTVCDYRDSRHIATVTSNHKWSTDTSLALPLLSTQPQPPCHRAIS